MKRIFDCQLQILSILKYEPCLADVLWSYIEELPEGITIPEFEDSLVMLRDESLIACANKVWYLR